MTGADTPARPGRCAVLERIVERAPGTRSLWLRPADGQPVRFVPGQFISCELPGGGERPLPRAYSIAGAEDDGRSIEICLDLVPGGAGSAYLFSLPPGATVDFVGPLGFFTMERAPERECVLVAAGTAVAALRPMVHRALATADGPPLTLVQAAEDESHLLYRDEMATLAAETTRFTYQPLVFRAELAGELLTHVRCRFVEADVRRDREIFACAVGDLALRLRDLFRGAGYPRREVHYERW